MIEASIHGIEQALGRCGVVGTTLTPGDRTALDRDGFVALPGRADAARLERLREALEGLFGRDNDAPGSRPGGTRHANDLVNNHDGFDPVYTDPRVLAAVYHILRREFTVFQLSGRDPLPGHGEQGLHTDWLPRAAQEPFSVVTAIWLLDAFLPNNGATRLVPASHLLTRPLPKPMTAPSARHPRQTIFVAPAGTVLLFNGHLWHGGTRNETRFPRRVIQCQFVARDRQPPASGGTAVPDRLSAAARYILAGGSGGGS